MSDMLVSLLDLPNNDDDLRVLEEREVNIRRAQPFELSIVRRFVTEQFGESWADEVMTAFTHQPVTCFVATKDKNVIGFAAYECTRRNFFGPTGVLEEFRGKAIGKALFLASLRAMLEMGYAYAIIGGVGPAEFYMKVAGASVIPDSTPGVYVDLLER